MRTARSMTILWGACMAGGMHGRGLCGKGYAWGACVAGGGIHDRGHVWQGGMHGRGCAWQGDMCGRGGMCAMHAPLRTE